MYQPSQRAVIIYEDGIEDLILQTKYEKGADDFAWVVPVPGYPEVDEADAEIFEELYYLTLPPNQYLDFPATWRALSTRAGEPSGVKLWERKKVGLYDVSILSATDPSALIEWLNENGYKFPEEAKEIVDFYIAKDWYFVAMRLEAEETQERQVSSEEIELIPDKTFSKGTTQPIKLRFNTTQIVYPMKITSLNPGDTEVLLYVFADGAASVDDFSVEYADWFHTKAYKLRYNLYPEKAIYGTSELLKELITKPYFLTKMRCSFSPDEMTHDLVISINSSRYTPYFVKRYYTVRDVGTQKLPVRVWPHTSQRDYDRTAVNQLPGAKNEQ